MRKVSVQFIESIIISRIRNHVRLDVFKSNYKFYCGSASVVYTSQSSLVGVGRIWHHRMLQESTRKNPKSFKLCPPLFCGNYSWEGSADLTKLDRRRAGAFLLTEQTWVSDYYRYDYLNRNKCGGHWCLCRKRAPYWLFSTTRSEDSSSRWRVSGNIKTILLEKCFFNVCVEQWVQYY